MKILESELLLLKRLVDWNIMHTRYRLQSLKAWSLVQSLVYQRNLGLKTIRRAKVILLLRHLWEARSGYMKENPIPTWKDSMFKLIHNSTRGLEGKLQERFPTIHNQPWSEHVEWHIKNKKCHQMCTQCPHQVDSSVSWQPKVQRNNPFCQIYKSASIGNSWTATPGW